MVPGKYPGTIEEGVGDVFRFKKAIPVDYDTQGYIYFLSKRYSQLTPGKKQKVEQICKEAGGEHYHALLEFVTTDAGAVSICTRYYISQSTLERAVRRYYLEFEKQL